MTRRVFVETELQFCRTNVTKFVANYYGFEKVSVSKLGPTSFLATLKKTGKGKRSVIVTPARRGFLINESPFIQFHVKDYNSIKLPRGAR